MQADQTIPVVTGNKSGVLDYWDSVSRLLGGAECVITPPALDSLSSSGSVAIADLTSDVDPSLFEHIVKNTPGYPNRHNALICLANTSSVFVSPTLPDAILTAPCPADVFAGTINQLQRLLIREQEFQIRKEALISIGCTDPDARAPSNEKPASVLILGNRSDEEAVSRLSEANVNSVVAPTLSAAQGYMKWHKFALAIANVTQPFNDLSIQEIQSVLKGIPLIITMVECDHHRQRDLYMLGAIDVIAGPSASNAIDARIRVATNYSQRINRSKAGLASTKDTLSALPIEKKRTFAEAYRALLEERDSASSTMKSLSIEAYEPTLTAMRQDLSDSAVNGIQTVLEIATRDEDLSLFLGEDQVLTILAGTDTTGAAIALRRIAAILKSTDLPATQDGQKIRVNLRGTSGTGLHAHPDN